MKFRLTTAAVSAFLACVFAFLPPARAASTSFCSLEHYKASPGLVATSDAKSLLVTWNGEGDDEVRLRFSIVNGIPTIQDLSVRRKGGA
jgi:hypothetical protein